MPTHIFNHLFIFFNSYAVLFSSCGEAEGDETLTASEDEDELAELNQTKGEEDMDISDTDKDTNNEGESEVKLCYGPETRDLCTERLKLALKTEFNKVNAAGKKSKMFVDHGQQKQAIIDVDLVLFQNSCFKIIVKSTCVLVNVL